MRKIIFHAEFISIHHSEEDQSGYWSQGTPEELDNAVSNWANKEANRLNESGLIKGGYKVSNTWITIGP